MTPEKEKINIIKLSQNENPFGASPKALTAIANNYQSIYRYPDMIHETLRNKLAQKYERLTENIINTAGSVELVDLIIKTFVGFNENIVTSKITFVAYDLLAKINQRECRHADLVAYTINPQNILSLCDAKTKVVFIANPNNPTGTIISHNSLRELLQTLPSSIFVAIDEAYAEYVTDGSYPDSFELQKIFPNLIILRTFSKIYGLAGLRIGYAVANKDIIQSLLKNRTPFSVSNLAAAAACAALDDTEFITECAFINQQERVVLYNELTRLDCVTVPSNTNFIFAEFKSWEEKDKILNSLKSDGILARDIKPFGVEKGLRLSIGRPEENLKLIKCLRQIVF